MTTKITERQDILTASAFAVPANDGALNGFTFNLPVNALLLAVIGTTHTAFDSTTNTLTVGDGTTTFINAVDIKSAGAETSTVVPKFYPSGGTISAVLASTGAAPTVGLASIVIQYIVKNRGGEQQF